MKKYKEWLTNEIEIMESETSENYPHEQMVEREVVLNLINQLDEPEVTELDALNRLAESVQFSAGEIASHLEKLSAYNGQVTYGEPETLSQNWIDEHRKSYTMEDSVEVSDLQNLLVPKQELPVIPKYVAEYLDFAKKEASLIQVMVIVSEGWPTMKKEFDWISENDEIFARAWLDGYEVEEQKYVLPIDENHALCKFTNVVWGIYKENTDKLYLEDYFKFTEQEIKDYDERFWAFAVPVEEAELF